MKKSFLSVAASAVVAVISIGALFFFSSALASSRVKKVQVQNDQIVRVNTAVGIATIIQVPDRPNSVVVGDQDAFKVEYLDLAITIKPLTPHGKSNLYIYTDYRRFNVELVSGTQADADFVVYLENPKAPEEKKSSAKEGLPISWKSIGRSFKNGDLKFTVNRVGTTRSGVIIAEFKINTEKEDQINPSWFWVTQGGATKAIQNLFLSDVKVSSSHEVRGSIQILKKDLSSGKPLRIEMRRTKTTYLTLKEVKT